jgi:hypothetical protein
LPGELPEQATKCSLHSIRWLSPRYSEQISFEEALLHYVQSRLAQSSWLVTLYPVLGGLDIQSF